MDQAQLDATRDALIADLDQGDSPLAIKFQPMLIDKLAATMDKAGMQTVSTPDELAAIKAECAALAAKWHAIAIAALRDELKNDPEQLGYAGQKPDQVQKLLTTERTVTEERPRPPSQMEMIKQAVAGYLGKDYVAPAPVMDEVVIETKPPRVSVIWDQIPYCRNLPTADNIAEALA